MNDKWDDRLCTGNKCLATEWAREMAAPKAKAPLTPRPPSTPPPPPTPPPTPPAPQSTPAATEAVEVPAHLSTLRALVQGAGLPTAPTAKDDDADEPEEDVEIDAVGACPAALTVAGKDIEGQGVPHEAQEEEQVEEQRSRAKANLSFNTVVYLCH